MRPLILAALAAIVVVTALPSAPTAMPADAQCVRPTGVQRLVFSRAKYPSIRRHFRRAVLRRGWPRRLVVNRPGADARRERLLRDIPTREGFDRDEVPARGRTRPWAGIGARPRPAGMEGRCAPRAQLREPLAWRVARRTA